MKKLNILGTRYTLPFAFFLSGFVFLLQPLHLKAQVCTDDITLSTQTQVDAFSCAEVIGNLTVSGADITNLDGLVGLTIVGGDFFIQDNPSLVNIDGLADLINVWEHFKIWNNPALTNLDSLLNFTSAEIMTISSNPALTNLEGLASLTVLPEGLRISNNDALPHLDGLKSLADVYYLVVSDNDILTNLDGLANLKYVEYVVIRDNIVLSNLDGLISVPWVYEIYMEDNIALNSFCGLYNILSGDKTNIYSVFGNSINPTEAEILTGGHCSDFTLIDAITDKTIGYLYEGSTLDLAALPTDQLAIRANLEGPDVTSVRFSFQNVAKYRIENFAPYALHGDSNGDYNAYAYTPGSYTVSATTYDKRNGKGDKGLKRTVNFTVIDSNTGARITDSDLGMKIYPNPAQTKFTLELEGLSAGELTIGLYNLIGKLMKQHSVQTLGGNHLETISLLNLPSGIYIVRVQNEEIVRMKKVVKK